MSLAQETLKVALLDSYPWSFEGDDGKIKGIYPSILRKIEAKLDGALLIDLQITPMARILHDIQDDGGLDITIMSFRSEREKVMVPFVSLYRTPFVVISHRDSPIGQLADLQDKSVAMLWGGSGCPCLDDTVSYQKVKVNNHEQSMRMLTEKRVDAIAGPAIRLLGQADNFGAGEFLAPALVYEWRDVWLWSSKKKDLNKEAVELLKFELDKILAAGILKSVASNYLSSSQLEFIHKLNEH
jgi:ABC-type amino acid transport substrate-binding protein